MLDSDILKQIAENLREFRSETKQALDTLTAKVSELDKQQAIQSKDIEFIKIEDTRQNQLLDEHIEGVRQAREQNVLMKEELKTKLEAEIESLTSRLKKLEAPGEWIKKALWLVVTIGGVAYALLHVTELLKLLTH